MTERQSSGLAHAGPPAGSRPGEVGGVTINAATGLATDYLNQFHEAIMLLEMVPDMPDCIGDLMAWQPRGYREHFEHSRFSNRAAAICSYDEADPKLRRQLDAIGEAMGAVLIATRDAMRSSEPKVAAVLADRAAAWLKPLVARAGAVINGTSGGPEESDTPQVEVDALLRR